jgi:hypothetical protein
MSRVLAFLRSPRAALAVACLAAALPWLLVRHPPFTDVPEHVASIASVYRLLVERSGEEPYVLALGQSQYFLYSLCGALLTVATRDAVLTNQVLLAMVAAAWPLSLRSLLVSVRRDPRQAVFGAVLVHNRALALGFLPFLASVPVFVWTLAALFRFLERRTLGRGAWLGVLTLVLFYAHVSTFTLLVAIAAVLPFSMAETRAQWRKAVPALGAAFAPAVLVATAWSLKGSLFRNAGATENRHFAWMSAHRAILSMPIWALDIWKSHGDEVAAILFWLGVGAIVILAGRERDRETWSLPVLAVPALVAIAFMLVTPFDAGNSSFLNVRLAPVALLLGLLPLRLHAVERGWIPVAFGLSAALVASGTSLVEARSTEQRLLGDFDALVSRTAPNKRLAILNFTLQDNRTHFWPYSFAGAYYRAEKGGVSSWGFAELVHWPLHFRPESKPPARAPFWNFEPCEYRYEEDGAYYDYVLVQGAAEPFAEGAPGPRFRLLGTSGRFQLYEKVGNATSKLEDPTMNPCRWISEKATRVTP